MKGIYALMIVLVFAIQCRKPVIDLDTLIINAIVIDGSGHKSFLSDIGIEGDSIAFIGKSSKYEVHAKTIIDASEYYLAPGFIDPHTHAAGDLNSLERNSNLNYLTQGVTTVFIGSDGRSATDIKTQFEKLEVQGIGTNVASYVGHATARRLVMGMRNEVPTAEELENMRTFVRNGMKAGAIGLGSGLYYAPANFALTEEVIELAKIAAEYGGSYDVHMRDESSYNIGLVGAITETIEIARQADIHANIAHIKCLGADVWNQSDKVIQLIEDARMDGLNVTADQYPYHASGTSITGALIPRWFLADDPSPADKLKNPETVLRLKSDIKENIRKRGGAETLLLTRPSESNIQFQSMNLQEVADHEDMDPIDATIMLFKNGGSSVGSFNMQESDIVNFMKQDWIMTSSDGSTGHPRKYGSFPKKLKEYVLEKNVLSLEEFIHKSSGFTASTFNLNRRGMIKVGYYADLIIFKPEEVRDNATFNEPELLSEGIHYVILNGEIVIKEGKFHNRLVGRVLRRN